MLRYIDIVLELFLKIYHDTVSSLTPHALPPFCLKVIVTAPCPPGLLNCHQRREESNLTYKVPRTNPNQVFKPKKDLKIGLNQF